MPNSLKGVLILIFLDGGRLNGSKQQNIQHFTENHCPQPLLEWFREGVWKELVDVFLRAPYRGGTLFLNNSPKVRSLLRLLSMSLGLSLVMRRTGLGLGG